MQAAWEQQGQGRAAKQVGQMVAHVRQPGQQCASQGARQEQA